MHKGQAKHSGQLKGLLFDLDGTLVDSLSATFDGLNHGLTAVGVRPHSPSEFMAHFGPGENDILGKIAGPEKARAAFLAYRAFIDGNMGRIPLHAGVAELLETLKSHEVPIAIVTGRGWESAESILKHHGLLDRFVTVVANDHVSACKPSPEGIHLALSRMKLDPHQTLYVGDSPMDMGAARRAGSGSVAALWDLLTHRDHLAPLDPHHWAEHPSQVWDLWMEHRAPSL